MEVVPGTKIADRYVIERALAKGGMGAVFVARDEQMGVRVALKVTAAAGAAADQLGMRFAREARIGNRLGSRHQGFVRSLGWGRVDAVQLYLVMDLVEGAKPLDLSTGSREERVARWRRAADLVRIAHENGVVHRDLKPANFLQAPNGTIYLTDFGLAKVVGEEVGRAPDEQVSLTMTGVGFGTPPYMPPEQLEDAKHADQRADVFALGCMLFEALVGRLPYPGPAPTGVMSAHLKVKAGLKPAPRPRDDDASVPEALDQACLRALELDVARRAPSVAALLEAVDGGAPTRLESRTAPSTIGAAATIPPDVRSISGAAAAPHTLSGTPTVPPDASPGPSAPALPSLPVAAAVPPPTPSPQPSLPSAPSREGPKRVLVVTGALLLVMAGAVAGDVAGLRRRLVALVAPPETATERPPEPSPTTERSTETPPPAPTYTLADLSPADGDVTEALTIDVSGRLDPPAAGEAWIAGIVRPVGPDGRFRLQRFELKDGLNELPVLVTPAAATGAAATATPKPIQRTLRVTVDRVAPQLALTSPADGGETTEDAIDVTGTVEDATLRSLMVGLRGERGEAVTGLETRDGTFRARVALPRHGPATLEVVATDGAGHETRVSRQVTRHALPVPITITEPRASAQGESALVNRDLVRVVGRVAGDVPADALEVLVDGVVTPLSSDRTFEATVRVAEGSHDLVVVATGRTPAGSIEGRASRSLHVDLTAPVVGITAPADGSRAVEEQVTVQASVTDASPWVDVTLTATGATTGAPRTVRVLQGQALSERVALSVGETTLALACVDAAGNRGVDARLRVTRASGLPAGVTGLPVGVSPGQREGEWVHDKTGIVLVWVPPGTFRMGSDAGESDEKPAHEVQITRGYFVGKTEVTWGQFDAFCRGTGRKAPEYSQWGGDDLPVVMVSWDDARAYCDWAGLRLPTEDEWEYAARGPDGRTYPWGNEDPGPTRGNVAGAADGFATLAPVGSFPAGASPFGALDMAGNVWEWCEGYHVPYGVQPTSAAGSGTLRPMRGGAYDGGGAYSPASGDCRASNRTGYRADGRHTGTGLRVVLSSPLLDPAPPVRIDPPPVRLPPGLTRLPPGVSAGQREGEWVHDVTGIALVWVPPGRFRMGSDAGGKSEKPVHEVRITRGYFVGKAEVTWGQWRAYCRAAGTTPPSNVINQHGEFEAGDGHPVFGVSWGDAQGFCRWAGLRLPTEAEWEYAARGADGRTYPWGNESPGPAHCNIDQNWSDGFLWTAPVGSFPAGASPFGALDMTGNVEEWCQDWEGPYTGGVQTDPTGAATGEVRIARGGYWSSDAKSSRAFYRSPKFPDAHDHGLGLRVVLSSSQ